MLTIFIDLTVTLDPNNLINSSSYPGATFKIPTFSEILVKLSSNPILLNPSINPGLIITKTLDKASSCLKLVSFILLDRNKLPISLLEYDLNSIFLISKNPYPKSFDG